MGELFLCNKNKTDTYLEKHRHSYILRKNSQKQGFSQTLFSFGQLDLPKRLGNWTQFRNN